MPSVRIWALESDYDQQAVQHLAQKLADFLASKVQIRTSGKSALANLHKQPDGLQKAVANYLKERDCCGVIFVIDADSSASEAERIRQPNSLLNQVNRVLQCNDFGSRVHLVKAVQELEAWLLVDCLGIACYFARTRYHKLDSLMCRSKAAADFGKVIKKYQRGDTTLIVEPFPGGPGAKESLVEFSCEVLKALNPKLKPSDVDERSYTESLAPEIALFVAITAETLGRNSSLQKLGKLISECENR